MFSEMDLYHPGIGEVRLLPGDTSEVVEGLDFARARANLEPLGIAYLDRKRPAAWAAGRTT